MRLGVNAVWRNIVWVAGCTALALLPSAASAAPIAVVSGSTLACFGEDCSGFEATVNNRHFGVAFSALDSFELLLDPSGIGTVTLGTFTRSRTRVSSDVDPLWFTLQVTLTLPDISSTSGWFTGSISGTTPGGGGPVAIDFENSWHRFATPTGAFEFAVLSDLSLNKNGSGTLVGSVRKAADTTSPTSVPEPATLVLLGLGLAGVAARRRRQ